MLEVWQDSISQAFLCIAAPPRLTRAVPAGEGAPLRSAGPSRPASSGSGCGSPAPPPLGLGFPCALLSETLPSTACAEESHPFPAPPLPQLQAHSAKPSSAALPSSPPAPSPVSPAEPTLTIYRRNPRASACYLHRSP